MNDLVRRFLETLVAESDAQRTAMRRNGKFFRDKPFAVGERNWMRRSCMNAEGQDGIQVGSPRHRVIDCFDAVLLGAKTLYSEDLQELSGVRIANPFPAAKK